MVSVGVENSNNVGIDNVSVDATSFVRTYAGRIVARIHNYRRDKEVSVPVALLINDKEEARKTVTVSRRREQRLAEFSGFDLRARFCEGQDSRSWPMTRCRWTTSSCFASNVAKSSTF